MDYHEDEIISSFLIILTILCMQHINWTEASNVINLSHHTQIENSFYKINNGSSSLSNQRGTYMFAGYKIRTRKRIYGISADPTVWSPSVVRGDWSAALISIGGKQSGPLGYSVIDEINAGWMVNPIEFEDMHPRIFASYKIDHVWCYSYNPSCPKFVVTNRGAFRPLTNTSSYSGASVFLHVSIAKNTSTNHWYLDVTINGIGYEVGYWKASEMSRFSEADKTLMWGGKVYSSSSTHRVPMGSGIVPDRRGLGQASVMANLGYIGWGYSSIHLPSNWGDKVCEDVVTDPSLYSVRPMLMSFRGRAFWYGGPN